MALASSDTELWLFKALVCVGRGQHLSGDNCRSGYTWAAGGSDSSMVVCEVSGLPRRGPVLHGAAGAPPTLELFQSSVLGTMWAEPSTNTKMSSPSNASHQNTGTLAHFPLKFNFPMEVDAT